MIQKLKRSFGPPTCLSSLGSSATPGGFSRLTDVALAPVSPEDAGTDVMCEEDAATDVETLLAVAVFDLAWREKIFKSKFNGIHTHMPSSTSKAEVVGTVAPVRNLSECQKSCECFKSTASSAADDGEEMISFNTTLLLPAWMDTHSHTDCQTICHLIK